MVVAVCYNADESIRYGVAWAKTVENWSWHFASELTSTPYSTTVKKTRSKK